MKRERLIEKRKIKTNSKYIDKGDIFVCALSSNKEQYLWDALRKEASLVITDKPIKHRKVLVVQKDINRYLKELLDKKYYCPLSNKTLIGITGTDGKTTTASILRYMLEGASIGTNGLEFIDYHENLLNTTPSLDVLYDCFKKINEHHLTKIIMEVSSESYLTKRIPYLSFDIGIFLNISKEHLDKHPNFMNYLACKKELLQNSQLKIINRDTKYFKDITKGLTNYVTFGKKKSDLQILHYKLSFTKTAIKFKYQKKIYHLNSPLLGKYNVYNLAAAILCMFKMYYSFSNIQERILKIQGIPGRMEKLIIHGHLVIIDYAHTENATKNVLQFLKKYTNKKIVTIVGCAGGRYKEKRANIGKTVLKYSHYVYLTMDDPRWENPYDIIKEMLKKTKKKNYEIVLSRREAIIKALKMLKKDELLLILGKGHDNYMAINDYKVPYSDIEVLNDNKKM